MRRLLFVFAICVGSWSNATELPPCLNKGTPIGTNNDQVISWKRTTKNQFHSRAHVEGKLTQVYPDRSGHHHFQIQISSSDPDTLEIIYNEAFGSVPALKVGAHIEVCGDYITSNQRYRGFPQSPDGAIVHWVHRSPSSHHPSGYLVVDDVLTGQN